MVYEVGSRYPKPGDKVRVAQKKDYASGELTSGTVKDVLTSKRFHPRGHKVRLTSGIIGRVQEFVDMDGEKIVDASETSETEQAPRTPSEDELV